MPMILPLPQKKNTNNLKKNPNKDIGEYIDYEEID